MKKQKKPRFNVIDGAVIILIVAALVLTVVGNYIASSSDDTASIIFYLKIRDISDDFKDKISVGDKIYNHNDGATLGTVSEVSDTSPIPLNDNSENKDVLYISVKTEATIASGGYIVNGMNISAANSLEIRFPHLFCKAECIGCVDLAQLK